MNDHSLHYRTCPLCEVTCGLEVAVEDGKVARIHGDRDDVFSHGFGWDHGVPGTRLNVAGRPGVNSNVLTDESIIDPLSGNGVLNGIPVDVQPVSETV